MSESPFLPLRTEDDWTAALARSTQEPVLIFKHSSACPTSARADGEMSDLAASGDLPVYKLVVQESRSLSNAIAATLEVDHQTPQSILLADEAVVFDASHHRVKADAIRDAVREQA